MHAFGEHRGIPVLCTECNGSVVNSWPLISSFEALSCVFIAEDTLACSYSCIKKYIISTNLPDKYLKIQLLELLKIKREQGEVHIEPLQIPSLCQGIRGKRTEMYEPTQEDHDIFNSTLQYYRKQLDT